MRGLRLLLLCLPALLALHHRSVPPPPAQHRSLRSPAPRLGWLGGAAGLTEAAAAARKREEGLVGWLEANGVYMSPKSTWGRAGHPLRVESDTVDDFEPSGRGLIARRSIIQNEPLLEIPTKLVMTKARAQEILGRRVIPDEMGEYIALALLLVHERAKGAESFFAPYVGVLPDIDEVGPSYVWREEELALLEGSGALATTRSFQAKLEAEYATLQQTTLAQFPDVFPADVLTFEAFRWGMAMLFSRGVDLKDEESGTGQLGLVPYADLLNHSPYSSSNFLYNSIPFSRDKEVVLYADRPYAINDQARCARGPPEMGAPEAAGGRELLPTRPRARYITPHPSAPSTPPAHPAHPTGAHHLWAEEQRRARAPVRLRRRPQPVRRGGAARLAGRRRPAVQRQG